MELTSKEIGKIGEDIACGYLLDNYYKIVARNYKIPFGEIDIIAKSPDKTIVFIEVKALCLPNESGNVVWQSYPHISRFTVCSRPDTHIDNFYNPEEKLHYKKLKKLRGLSEWYINTYFPNSEFRVDGICILLFSNETYALRYYENIVFE